MRRSWKIFAFAFLTIGASGILLLGPGELALAQSFDAVELREGQAFPTTVFPSLNGNRPSSVADFRGKKLILHIFASW